MKTNIQGNYVHFYIDQTYDGKRLNDFFDFYHISKKMRHKLRMEKKIQLNHQTIQHDPVLHEQDLLSIECMMEEECDFIAQDISFTILYEDELLLILDKPAGIIIHPDDKNGLNTLANGVSAYYQATHQKHAVRHIHRLDKDTSGVMVFAKSDAAFRGLVKIFSSHDLTRKYIAFVWGVPNWDGADITGNLARSSRNRQKMSLVKSGGKPAHTIVNVSTVWPRAGVSEFRCTLMTGRTHQIRVHLSAHGFPVLCDPLYGRTSNRLATVRDADLLEFLKNHDGQMLHAEILDFTHPVTGEKLHFKAKLPADMYELKSILDEIG